MRKTLGALCVLLALAVSSRAATVWTGANVRVDASAPVHVGINLEAVTLTAVGLDPLGHGQFQPNAFDGNGGHLGITTVGHALHQVWEFTFPGGAPTPTLDVLSPGDAAFQSIDSHFLLHSADIQTQTSAPTENQLDANPSENAHAGFGDSLTATFSLAGAPSTSWSFAYLVVPAGTTINLDFFLADGNTPAREGGQYPKELVNTSFVVVPEPSAYGLMLLAAIALLTVPRARRRW